MIKFLIKIANELDKRFLSKEADIVDKVLLRVFALDKDKKPKLRLLPPLEGDNETPDIQTDSPRMSSPVMADVDELESYRQRYIEFYEDVILLNKPGETPGEMQEIRDAMYEIERYKNLSHDEIIEEMKSESALNNAFNALNDFSQSTSQSSSYNEPSDSYQDFLNAAFAKSFKKLIKNYGVDKLEDEIVTTYGRSRYDREYSIDENRTILVPDVFNTAEEQIFEIIRRDDRNFFKAIEDLPLSAIVAYLTTETMCCEPTDDWWHYEDILENAAMRNPIELRYMFEKTTDDSIKPYLKDFLEKIPR